MILLSVLAFITPQFLFTGCYSFKGTSIPADVTSYYIALFENQAPASTPTLPRDFTERLRDKIRRESRLTYRDIDPDIEFKGAISDFRVTMEAPRAGEQISYNKLSITVMVEFINHKNEKANWKQQFSYFDLFQPDQNLIDVQDALIETISKELVDQIFNRAFTDW